MGKIIGLTGWGGVTAGVGKDTAANFLMDQRRGQFRTVAFADPIRAAMTAIFGWDSSFYGHPKKNEVDERYGISPRKAMQTLGTEWGRNLINTDLWLIIAGQKAFPMVEAGFDVLITDTRFENEAEWIRKNGGVVWHIQRDQKSIVSGAGAEVKHTSEAGIKFVKGDVKINNNETMGYFYDQLEKLGAGLATAAQRAADKAAVERLKPFAVPALPETAKEAVSA